MASLTASADIHGRAINLSLAWSDPSTWSDPSGQPRSVRIVRRRWGYPTGPDDGLVLVDLTDLFLVPASLGDPPAWWSRVDVTRFLLLNPRAEGGVVQASLTEQWAAADQPSQVIVAIYDPGAGALVRAVLAGVTSVVRTTTAAGTTVAISAGPSGQARVSTLFIAAPSAAPSATVTDFTLLDPVSGAPLVTQPTGAIVDHVEWTPAPQAVTGASQGSPIAVTTAGAHGLASGVKVTIAGVAGNLAANGDWTIVVSSATTFTLTESIGSAPYAGGGTVTPARTSVAFSRQETQRTTPALLAQDRDTSLTKLSFTTTMAAASGPVVTCAVELTEALDPDTGDLALDRAISVVDRAPPTRTDADFDPGLLPGVTYYYTAFEGAVGGLGSGPTWSASALATDCHGFAEKLFNLLPAVHRYYDDPASGHQGSWQLRSFLEIFGAGLDQVRSTGEALATLHDVLEVRADLLPHLAQLIGWRLDRTLPPGRQRSDILFAPEVYATVGTVPNLRAMVNRATGWGCQVKELVNNVFLTNAVEPIRLWEIWQAALPADGTAILPSVVAGADGDSIDSRPAIVAEPTAGAPPWMLWDSDRPDRTKTPPLVGRQLWMSPAGGALQARPVLPLLPPPPGAQDEWPTAIVDGASIDLFWSSNRLGSAGLWTVTLTNGVAVPGTARAITDHPAGDHCPAALRDPATGDVWLLWQSSRRGRVDLWQMARKSGAAVWSPPRRVVFPSPPGPPIVRCSTPALVVDAAHVINLFFCADLGDRSRILQTTWTGSAWTTPVYVSAPAAGAAPFFRDEAPAAVLFDGTLWAFWQSNRDGRFAIWASRQQAGGAWGAPSLVTQGRSSEKDAAPFVTATSTGSSLGVLFRTQRGGETYRSRTVYEVRPDPASTATFPPAEMKPGQADDRWHYTYSTDGVGDYGREVVAVYLTPTSAPAGVDPRTTIDRVKALVEPFRPLPVRLVWPSSPAAEVVHPAHADIGESTSDVLNPAPAPTPVP